MINPFVPVTFLILHPNIVGILTRGKKWGSSVQSIFCLSHSSLVYFYSLKYIFTTAQTFKSIDVFIQVESHKYSISKTFMNLLIQKLSKNQRLRIPYYNETQKPLKIWDSGKLFLFISIFHFQTTVCLG